MSDTSVQNIEGQKDERLSYMPDIIKTMYDSKYGEIFRLPVDPERDNLPEYFDIITAPMDLSTIIHKLEIAQYKSADEVVADFTLMINNCYTYNPEGSVAHYQARELERLFLKRVQRLPFNLNLLPFKRKKSFKNDDKNKSKIKKCATPIDSPPLTNHWIDFCNNCLSDLIKKNQEHAQYFLSPVDPVSLNIPDYFEVIKYPMDFGTIRNKIKNYNNPRQFLHDVRLVFSNCYRYNAPEMAVFKSAQALQNFFEHQIAAAPLELYNDFVFDDENVEIRKSERSRRSTFSDSRYPDQFNNIDLKLTKILDEIAKIKVEKPKKTDNSQKILHSIFHPSNFRYSSANPPVMPTPPVTEPQKIDEPDPMTYDEKLQLCSSIMALSERKVAQVIALVNQKEPWSRKFTTNNDKKEMEFDLNTLHSSTLRAIEKYVASVTKKKTETLRKKCTPQERQSREAQLRDRLQEMECKLAGKLPMFTHARTVVNEVADKLSFSSDEVISDEEFSKRYSLKPKSSLLKMAANLPPLSNNTSLRPDTNRSLSTIPPKAANINGNPMPMNSKVMKNVEPSIS